MASAHVSLTGVTKRFDRPGTGGVVHALGPVDLDLRVGEFFAVVGPATMPRPIVDKLNATINAVLETPEVQTRLATNGGIVLAPMPVAQFATLLRTDIAKWKRISQEAGINVQ